MSDLYEGQFRRAEKARLRNKYEERRLKQEMERKHGMRETHEYRMRVITQERMLIEKELERIRMGIKRNSVQPDAEDEGQDVTPVVEDITPRPARFAPPPLRKRAMSLQDVSDKFRARRPDPVTQHVAPRAQHELPSADELLQSALRDTVLYAVKHGNKLQGQSDSYSDTDSDVMDGASVKTGGLVLVTKDDKEQEENNRSSVPRLDRLDSTLSTMTSRSHASSVTSHVSMTPRGLDRHARRRSTQIPRLTPMTERRRRATLLVTHGLAPDTDLPDIIGQTDTSRTPTAKSQRTSSTEVSQQQGTGGFNPNQNTHSTGGPAETNSTEPAGHCVSHSGQTPVPTQTAHTHPPPPPQSDQRAVSRADSNTALGTLPSDGGQLVGRAATDRH